MAINGVDDDANHDTDTVKPHALAHVPVSWRSDEAERWLKTAEVTLASSGLLQTANGDDPIAAAEYPELDPAQLWPETVIVHERDATKQAKMRRDNALTLQKDQQNTARRIKICVDAHNKLFRCVTEALQQHHTHKAAEMRDVCVRNDTTTGVRYYDGHIAWRMLVHMLQHPYDQIGRTEADADYYEQAHRMFESLKLPTGSAVLTYEKVTTAWSQHVRPNLERPFSDEAAGKFMLKLAPGNSRAPSVRHADAAARAQHRPQEPARGAVHQGRL